MLSERSIRLEAVDRRRNVFRSWRCEVATDLFGVTMVAVTFGRTGTAGRTIWRAVDDEAAALRLARRCLARRAGAERRIGVAYEVVESSGLECDDGLRPRRGR